MNSRTRPTVLVTGASAGIGKAFAEVFALNGCDLVLTARREERLRRLAESLASRHGTRSVVVAADLASPAGRAQVCDQVAAEGVHVDGLVNNAGYGVIGSYRNTTWQAQRDFLQVMVVAVAELTHHFLPAMVERGYGRIINVASVAGLVPSPPGHTLYGASKAFVIKFSEALAGEVRKHGVHVTAVCPGFTYSEFHDVTGTRDQVSRMPAFMWMDAETVARQGYEAVMRGEVIHVHGRVNRALVWLARHLPPRVAYRLTVSRGSSFRKE